LFIRPVSPMLESSPLAFRTEWFAPISSWFRFGASRLVAG
jgi:hypothetical protein